MVNYDCVYKGLEINDNFYLESFSSQEQVEIVLSVFKNDLRTFDYRKDYSYFLVLVPYLYQIEELSNDFQKRVYVDIQDIRVQIKRGLYQIKKIKENANLNRKILIKLLGKLEVVSLTVSKSFDDNYDENKLELLKYLIFNIRNLDILKDVIKSMPHLVNSLDAKSMSILEEVVKSFVNNLAVHVNDKNLGNLESVLYFDNVLKILLKNEESHLTFREIRRIEYLFKQNILNNERYQYYIYKWINDLEMFTSDNHFSFSLTKEEVKYRYNLVGTSSFAVNEIANNLYLIHNYQKIKLGYKSIYTLDGDGAIELDDGFSCEREGNIYHLGVHIANPMFYLDEDSLPFKEAVKKATSVYTGENFSMFPKCLGCDLFSLNEGNIKQVLSFYTDIDLESNDIVGFYIKEEKVFVEKNDKYSACNSLLNKKLKKDEYSITLKNIQKILPFLSSFYKMDDVYKELKRTNANITKTNVTGSSKAEMIIETLMVFTNYMMARFAFEEDIPFLYRSHRLKPLYEKDLLMYKELISKEKNNQIYLHEMNDLISRYPASFYDPLNHGHFGLGLKYYTHITSPIRRVADDYNILMLKKFYFHEGTNEEKRKYLEKLKEIAEYINQRNNSLNGFYLEYRKAKKS